MIEVWAQDEGRFGLIPSVRRVWAPKGQRPTASSRRKYEWGYLYSFVHPATGELVHVLGNTVSTQAMSEVLSHFAEQAGAGPTKRIVLVWDGAGWHTSKDLVVPEGLHLVRLPARSPELQPAERIWPLIREAIANRAFDTLEQLIECITARCAWMDSVPDFIRGLTNFHWWPDDITHEVAT